MDHYTNMDNLINRLKKKINLPIENNEKQTLQHKNIYYSVSSNSIISIYELVAKIILGIVFIFILLILCWLFYWLLC